MFGKKILESIIWESIITIRYKTHIWEDLVLFGNLHFDLARRRLCYLEDSCGTQFRRAGRQYKCFLLFHIQIQMRIQIQIQIKYNIQRTVMVLNFGI